MRYSVSGISDELTEQESNFVAKVIIELESVDELTTGAAHGVDTVAFYAGVGFHFDAHHRVCIPMGCYYNQNVVEDAVRWAMLVKWVDGGYMARNDALVHHADKLIAFPRTAVEERRSGTWATVRRARKAGISVDLYPLDINCP